MTEAEKKELAHKKQLEYRRNWYRQNREKAIAQQQRYWLRKAIAAGMTAATAVDQRGEAVDQRGEADEQC